MQLKTAARLVVFYHRILLVLLMMMRALKRVPDIAMAWDLDIVMIKLVGVRFVCHIF